MAFDKRWLIPAITGVLGLIAIVTLIALFLIKWVWAWTIPDLFPGAVEQGLVAAEISWYTSFKLAVFVAILAAVSGARSSKSD